MRGLVQRVTNASVAVASDTVGKIDNGLVLFLGVQKDDSKTQADKLLHKVLHYRLFSDSDHKMNLSLQDIQGGLLIISQFTLAAETQKGLRPGFSTAASPGRAESLYQYFVQQAKNQVIDSTITIATGVFGANMQVALVNDGPVTFMLET